MSDQSTGNGPFHRIGAAALGTFRYVGGMGYLLADTLRWSTVGIFSRKVRFGSGALFTQMVRVGVRSLSIIVLVLIFIGIILALQMAPVLDLYGQKELVANVIGIAIFRELGPLLTAIVLTGFAGASIAAELGTMVVAEEIEALRAHALNPIRFLVVPRVVATMVMTVCLAVVADVVGVFGGWLTSVGILGIQSSVYYSNTISALFARDFLTGLVKAGVFGTIISLIACFEGLRVVGGAEGVGRATTRTVVWSIFALILADCIFTVIFFAYKW